MTAATPARIQHDTLLLGPVRVSFQRTLRVPETGLHPLPPGLGNFPLRRVEDYPDTVPAEWLARGGVMLPVHQREAMWLSFDCDEPAALQVGIGKVCAITGSRWKQKLKRKNQNYVPVPEQPWLDGINAGDGFIRQFVAVPLGLGATVEEQVTGEGVRGGVQLRAVPATEAYREHQARRIQVQPDMVFACGAPDMGLGAGGRMRQEIYRDDRLPSDYEEAKASRVFVYLCSASQWTAITGEAPPWSPVDREAYMQHGLPWFDYDDGDREDLAPSEELAKVTPVGDVLGKIDEPFTAVDPGSVITLKDSSSDLVATGDW